MLIRVKNNDPIKAYKILMKKLEDDGIFKKLKERKYYLSKSQKERLKHKQAILRIKKLERKRNQKLQREEEKFLQYKANKSK